MPVLPALYMAWTTSTVLFLALLLYRSTLTRYAEERLFLDAHDKYGERTQTEIIRKINRIRPLMYGIGTMAGIMSLGIVGVHVYDAIRVLQS